MKKTLLSKFVLVFSLCALAFASLALIPFGRLAQASGGKAYMVYNPANATMVLQATSSTDSSLQSFEVSDADSYGDATKVPWAAVAGSVTSVSFDASLEQTSPKFQPTSVAYWFATCTKLQTVLHFENLDTSQLQYMNSMFSGCSSLTSLNFSEGGAATITGIKNYESMFLNCSGLQTLNMSNFSMADQYDQSNMFNGCSALSTFVVSQKFKFSTGSAFTFDPNPAWIADVAGTYTNMGREATYNTFNTFIAGQAAGSIITFTHGAYVGPYMTYNQSTRTLTCDYGALPTGVGVLAWEIKDTYTEAAQPAWISDAAQATTVTFTTNLNANNYKPSSCAYWFTRLASLVNIENLTNLDFSAVTNVDCMFYKNSAIRQLDLSAWVTTNVASMQYTFADDTNLQNLNISGWSTTSSVNELKLFGSCYALKQLTVSNTFALTDNTSLDITASPSWKTFASNKFYDMNEKTYLDWNALIAQQSAPITFYRQDFEYVMILDTNALTLTLSAGIAGVASNVYVVPSSSDASDPAWVADAKSASVNDAIIDSSVRRLQEEGEYVTSMARWYNGISTINELEGLEDLDTSHVTSLAHTFAGTSIQELNIGSWSADSLTNMDDMCNGCTSLASINMSSFDFSQKSNVSMNATFNNCDPVWLTLSAGFRFFANSSFPFSASPAWEALNNGVVTSLAQDTTYNAWNSYLEGCGGIVYVCRTGNPQIGPYARYDDNNQRLVISYGMCDSSQSNQFEIEDTYSADSLPGWTSRFGSDITSVYFDVTCSLNNYRPTSMAYWFYNLSSLTSVYNASNMDVSDVTSIADLFANDTSLKALDLSPWIFSADCSMDNAFYMTSALSSITLAKGFAFSDNSAFGFAGRANNFWILNASTKAPTTQEGWNSYLANMDAEKTTFKLAMITLTYNANGGEFGTGASEVSYFGNTGEVVPTLPGLVSRDKYEVKGWSTKQEGELIILPYYFPHTSQTYYAQWERIPDPVPPAPTPDPEPTPGIEGGWHIEDAGWRYAVDGVYVSGWYWIEDMYGAHWYFFDEDGYMVCNQWIWSGAWYWVCSSGPMIQGLWQWIDNAWYGFWWNGVMCQGWVWDSDYVAWFYCYDNGVMASNAWVDGYYLNASGICVM